MPGATALGAVTDAGDFGNRVGRVAAWREDALRARTVGPRAGLRTTERDGADPRPLPANGLDGSARAPLACEARTLGPRAGLRTTERR